MEQNKFSLQNLSINIENSNDFWNKVKDSVAQNKTITFQYLNTHSFYLANKDRIFNEALKGANYLRAGGSSLIFANKLLKLFPKSIKKVTFNHFFYHFNGEKLFSQSKFRIFLLGGSEEVLNKISSRNKNSDNPLNIVGMHHGYFEDKDISSIIDSINNNNPDILLLGLGTPRSNYWIYKNQTKLNNIVVICVGNFFDIWAGDVKIAPKILYYTPFEWVYRILQDPKRLFKRYLLSNYFFIARIFKK